MLNGLTVAAIAAVGVAGAFYLVSGMSGMMGSYNGPVHSGWGGDVLNHDQVTTYLKQSGETGTADPKANQVMYKGKDVTIDLVAVQPGDKDQTFEVHGLTNPTLVVPLGATVHLNLVNMDYGDNMEHTVILTRVPPPYPYMSMMTTGHGIAAIWPLLPWRSSENVQQARYASLGTTFIAEKAGTYWYVCPTPRHAEEGMYGKFVIR